MSYEVEGVRGKGRPAWDDVELCTCSTEGHERAWFEKGGCTLTGA